ncbi:MAG: RluA family pseudouridine synthase [Tissierellaceae bacterium]
MDFIEILVGDNEDERIDAFLADELDNLSRTYIKKLISDGLVVVNGSVVKPRYIIKEGDLIQVQIPKPKVLDIKPENIPIDIFYEDDDILIVNKPKGMVVHPAPWNYTGTLVNALLYHVDNLSSINGIIRPGIVHRLDKDTSGLLIVAKNDNTHRFLSEQLVKREIVREYLALTHGEFSRDRGTINAPIGRDPKDRKRMAVNQKNGKEAITNFKVLKLFKGYSLVQANLKTGRTHQIRVHFSYINHPIVGDIIYGNRKDDEKYEGHFLHARKLGFIHPRTREFVEFETDLPEEFKEFINNIRSR